MSMTEVKQSIKVTLDEKENFIVENLETSEKRTLKTNQFWGSKFKYVSDFESTFLQVFDEKSILVLDEKAKQKMHNIINFNRIDN